jgi:hypothetical protein
MSSGSSGSRVAKPVPCFWSICDLTRRIFGCEWVECGGSGCVVCVWFTRKSLVLLSSVGGARNDVVGQFLLSIIIQLWPLT